MDGVQVKVIKSGCNQVVTEAIDQENSRMLALRDRDRATCNAGQGCGSAALSV